MGGNLRSASLSPDGRSHEKDAHYTFEYCLGAFVDGVALAVVYGRTAIRRHWLVFAIFAGADGGRPVFPVAAPQHETSVVCGIGFYCCGGLNYLDHPYLVITRYSPMEDELTL